MVLPVRSHFYIFKGEIRQTGPYRMKEYFYEMGQNDEIRPEGRQFGKSCFSSSVCSFFPCRSSKSHPEPCSMYGSLTLSSHSVKNSHLDPSNKFTHITRARL